MNTYANVPLYASATLATVAYVPGVPAYTGVTLVSVLVLAQPPSSQPPIGQLYPTGDA